MSQLTLPLVAPGRYNPLGLRYVGGPGNTVWDTHTEQLVGRCATRKGAALLRRDLERGLVSANCPALVARDEVREAAVA